MLTGLGVMATNFAVKNYLTLNLGHNPTIIIELAIGLAIGVAARTARHAHDELRQASATAGRLEQEYADGCPGESTDGVIQVLALVAERGRRNRRCHKSCPRRAGRGRGGLLACSAPSRRSR